MHLNDTVQDYVDAGDWLGLAGYYWELIPSAAHLWIVVGAVVFVAFFAMLIMFSPGATPELGTAAAKRAALIPIPERKIKPKGPVFIPMVLGKVTIDLQPTLDGTIHTVISGSSGLGKSSTVMQFLELGIGVLVVALDNTKPIRKRIREVGGVEWTNEPDWPVGIDLLDGDAQIVSEVLVEGWTMRSQGDSGKWRTIAQDRIWSALVAMDRMGIQRDMGALVTALWQKTGESEIDRACRDWAGRLMRLQRVMGSSLGQGLDLVQAMRKGEKVLLRLNPYIHPKDAPMIGGMLLVHARRVVQEAGVPFVLVIEEAGQLGDYQEEIEPLAQASRDRGCPVVLLTQNISVLPIKVTNNVSVWVSFAQEDPREMRAAAARLRTEAEHLEREQFPGSAKMQGVGWCYVRAPGVPTTLAHIDLPKTKVSERELPEPPRMVWDAEYAEPVQMDGWRPWTPALGDGSIEAEVQPAWVTGNRDAERMWAQCARTGQESILWSPWRGVFYDPRGCLEWQGGMTNSKKSGAARPRSTINRRDVTVYIEFYRWSRGSPEPTLDHLCDNPKCCDPDHLEVCSIGENVARNEPRQQAFELGGWSKSDGSWRRMVAA